MPHFFSLLIQKGPQSQTQIFNLPFPIPPIPAPPPSLKWPASEIHKINNTPSQTIHHANKIRSEDDDEKSARDCTCRREREKDTYKKTPPPHQPIITNYQSLTSWQSDSVRVSSSTTTPTVNLHGDGEIFGQTRAFFTVSLFRLLLLLLPLLLGLLPLLLLLQLLTPRFSFNPLPPVSRVVTKVSLSLGLKKTHSSLDCSRFDLLF